MTESARAALARLGVPRERQTHEALSALLPPDLLDHAAELDHATLAELMTTLLRKGIVDPPFTDAAEIAGRLRHGSHDCHLYGGVSELLELVLPHFKKGIERGEACVWVLPEGFTPDSAARALSSAVPDLARVVSRGQLELIGREECFTADGAMRPAEDLIDGWLARESDALIRGFTGLRAAADFYWVAPEDYPELLRYERLCRESVAGRRITSVCSFPLDRVPRARLPAVLDCHREMIYKSEPWWHARPCRADALPALRRP
jgi:hypothetical protein